MCLKQEDSITFVATIMTFAYVVVRYIWLETKSIETQSRLIANALSQNFTMMMEPHLIQHDLQHDPWALLVATMLLNRTRGSQVKPVLHKLLQLCPTPQALLDCPKDQVKDTIKCLGFYNRRTERLYKFSKAYLQRPNFMRASELPGVGKYGNDSWLLFCSPIKDVVWRNPNFVVTDKELVKYVDYKRSICQPKNKVQVQP